jgi:hypothetical protein
MLSVREAVYVLRTDITLSLSTYGSKTVGLKSLNISLLLDPAGPQTSDWFALVLPIGEAVRPNACTNRRALDLE